MVTHDGEGEGQVRRCVVHLHAARDAGKHVGGPDGNAAEFLQQGEDDGEPLWIDARCHPLGYGKTGLANEGLCLEKHGPGTFHGTAHHVTWGRGCALLQEYEARVQHGSEAVASHFQHADFVGSAEAVLDGADNAVLVIPVALEVDDRIYHVLQDARACNLAVLGHVSDEHGDAARVLCKNHQVQGAFPELGHGARRAGKVLLVDRLDGVDDQNLGLDLLGLVQDFF